MPAIAEPQTVSSLLEVRECMLANKCGVYITYSEKNSQKESRRDETVPVRGWIPDISTLHVVFGDTLMEVFDSGMMV